MTRFFSFNPRCSKGNISQWLDSKQRLVKFSWLTVLLVGVMDLSARSYVAPQPPDTLLLDSLIEEMWYLPSSSRSFELANQVYTLSDSLNYAVGLAEALSIMADYYVEKGDFMNAITTGQSMLEMAENTGQEDLYIEACLILARSNYFLDLEQEAETYMRTLIAMTETVKDSTNLALLYGYIGLYQMEQQRSDVAIKNLQMARDISLELYNRITDERKRESIVYNISADEYNINMAYIAAGRPDEAIAYFSQYIDEARQRQDSFLITSVYQNMGVALSETGYYEQSHVYFDSALHYAQQLGQSDLVYSTYECISDTYAKQREFQKALDFHQKYQSFKDSVVDFRTKQTVSQLNVQYETERKERALLQQQSTIQNLRISRQRIWLLVVILLAGLGVGVLFFKRMQDRARSKEQLLAAEEALVRLQLEKERLVAEQLQVELNSKEADLTNLALDIGRKNDFANQLMAQLEDLQKVQPADLKSKLRDVLVLLNDNLQVSEDLQVLQANVSEINQLFYQKLDQQFQGLTANDKYILGLIRLNLSNKDIAKVKGISADSAKVMRYRLRKKLKLTPDVDITSFLQNLWAPLPRENRPNANYSHQSKINTAPSAGGFVYLKYKFNLNSYVQKCNFSSATASALSR